VKELVLVGSSSELASNLFDVFSNNKSYRIHRISSRLNSSGNLLVNNYIDDSKSICDYISNLKNPYIIFFNGYLKENRPNSHPNTEEIFNTFKINYKIPLLLTKEIGVNSSDAKFIYISTMASVKYRSKNYIYGISKSLLEKKIIKLNLNHLILRFGKIETSMSADHGNPPFTLTKEKAASLVIELLDRKGIVYPTYGLKVMATLIKIVPSKLLNYAETKIK
jgi:dTDP-4-dehydrorhamnose reductase